MSLSMVSLAYGSGATTEQHYDMNHVRLRFPARGEERMRVRFTARVLTKQLLRIEKVLDETQKGLNQLARIP